MSGKFSNQKRKKKSPMIPVLVILVLILVISVAALLMLRPEDAVKPEQTTAASLEETVGEEASYAEETQPSKEEQTAANVGSLPFDLGQGLMLTGISNYAGIYMEDGSDEPVSGILMVTLENTSEEDLQLARIQLIYEDQTATFQISNLPAGRKIVALEQNRMAYTKEAPIGAKAESLAFVPEFAMYEDMLQISALDGALNIKNISGADMPGTIAVYYKNVAADMYYGGITYRVSIEGGLKAEEIRQIMSAHFDAENSEIVMVSYSG